MARKKTHRRKTTRHRRRHHGRVSGTQDMAMHALGIVGGAVAAKFIGKAIEGKVSPKIVAIGQLGLGMFLIPKFVPGTMGEAIGAGFMATGGTGLLTEFGVLKGIAGFDDDVLQMELMSGFNEQPGLPTLSGEWDDVPVTGMSGLPSLAGIEDDDVWD